MAKYKITIELIETVKKVGRDYEKIADTGNERDGGPVYAYVEYPNEETKATEVFSQQLDEELNSPTDESVVTRVVKAVHKIK